MVDWLTVSNAELSPNWRGTEMQGGRGKREIILIATLSPPEWPCEREIILVATLSPCTTRMAPQRGRLYLSLYTVTTRMSPALSWAAMRAIFNVSLIAKDKVTKTVSTDHTFFEERGEPKRNRTEVPLLNTSLNSLTLGQTDSRTSLAAGC